MILRAWRLGAACLLTAGWLAPAAAYAQSDTGGFAIGPRLTFIRGAADSTEDAQRFSGGVIRLGGGKTAIELAVDYRSGVTGDLTERIKDYPIQGSLLIFPVRARVAPYLLGGIGWYSQHVQRVTPGATTPVDEETTRRIGYHAGLGAEVRVHRRIGFYGDYRYTFIRFGEDETGPAAQSPAMTTTPTWIPFAERLRLSHEGSMWTWGATFYF
jgi:hypothetical protein